MQISNHLKYYIQVKKNCQTNQKKYFSNYHSKKVLNNIQIFNSYLVNKIKSLGNDKAY